MGCRKVRVKWYFRSSGGVGENHGGVERSGPKVAQTFSSRPFDVGMTCAF